jgi:hypothetical protein
MEEPAESLELTPELSRFQELVLATRDRELPILETRKVLLDAILENSHTPRVRRARPFGTIDVSSLHRSARVMTRAHDDFAAGMAAVASRYEIEPRRRSSPGATGMLVAALQEMGFNVKLLNSADTTESSDD